MGTFISPVPITLVRKILVLIRNSKNISVSPSTMPLTFLKFSSFFLMTHPHESCFIIYDEDPID